MSKKYAYDMWVVVAFNIGFFISFMPPKGKLEWRNMGLLSAFLVALFSERGQAHRR